MTLARISLYDEASLGWYFGEGQAAFERSTFGSMLERQELFSVQHGPAPELVAARRAREPHEQPPSDLMPGPWRLDARPRPHQHQATGYTPNETALARYARVSRRLQLVAAESDLSAAVLAAYYGDQGVKWGRTPHGRLYAVCALTDAGLELLRRANERQPVRSRSLSAPDSLRAELAVQRVQPQPARALLIEKARREAVRLYDQAAAHWVNACERAREGGTHAARRP